MKAQGQMNLQQDIQPKGESEVTLKQLRNGGGFYLCTTCPGT